MWRGFSPRKPRATRLYLQDNAPSGKAAPWYVAIISTNTNTGRGFRPEHTNPRLHISRLAHSGHKPRQPNYAAAPLHHHTAYRIRPPLQHSAPKSTHHTQPPMYHSYTDPLPPHFAPYMAAFAPHVLQPYLSEQQRCSRRLWKPSVVPPWRH